jgi:DNA-binding YbaB/EbfC family protein
LHWGASSIRYPDDVFAKPGTFSVIPRERHSTMFNMQQMMKQAQKMQDQMKGIQEEMEQSLFTGTAGGGAVTVTCNGKYEFISVKIKPEALEDKDTLEDLMLAALQDASNKVTEAMEQKMAKITAGLNIPGFKLPGF